MISTDHRFQCSMCAWNVPAKIKRASRRLHLISGAVMLTVGETSRSTSPNMRLKCVSSLVRIFCACGKEHCSYSMQVLQQQQTNKCKAVLAWALLTASGCDTQRYRPKGSPGPSTCCTQGMPCSLQYTRHSRAGAATFRMNMALAAVLIALGAGRIKPLQAVQSASCSPRTAIPG